tara:strand:- start:103376 stop:103534 length:159 start_codon:yes stop_codon:yes gene_type:complete
MLMRTYKITKQKVFESERKFEVRLNELASMGWKAISVTMHGIRHSVLLEKDK